MIAALRLWPARRWWTALAAAVATTLVIAIPTALIETPIFGREIPPTWWAWPSLLVSAALAGLLIGSYVNNPAQTPRDTASRRGGWAGGALTFFAVGCPVCNKLVLLALGSAGALTWFEPVQPLLQIAAVVLLAWALRQRLLGELSCPAIPKEVHV